MQLYHKERLKTPTAWWCNLNLHDFLAWHGALTEAFALKYPSGLTGFSAAVPMPVIGCLLQCHALQHLLSVHSRGDARSLSTPTAGPGFGLLFASQLKSILWTSGKFLISM